ncbi:MAG: hypothetical protein POH28_01355 [Acidocella sp.]|nr:hypothetical protein [Acidocella sp.]
MNDIMLTLGGVSFRDMEVPEAIAFGGAQRLSGQQLLGGGRVVNALGFDDDAISFSGIFSGADAVERAQLLDAMRVSGAAVPLGWDRFFYIVVISKFSAAYHKTSLIPFTLTCVVVDDPAERLAMIEPLASGLVASDLAAAAVFGVQANVDTSALQSANITVLNAFQGIVQSAIVTSGGNLAYAGAEINSLTDAGNGVANIEVAVGAASTLAALAGMSPYVNRGVANLAGILP